MEALALDFMNLTHLLGNLKDEFLDACRNPFLRTGQARYELINGASARDREENRKGLSKEDV